MMPNRVLFIVSALITAAFLGVVAYGLATSRPAEAQATELMRVIDGFAVETVAFD